MADVHLAGERDIYNKIVDKLSKNYEIKEDKDVSKQIQEVSKIFSVPSDQLEKTIERFLEEVEIKKKRVNTLKEACDDLFSEWKKSQKDKKKVSTDDVETLIKSAEIVPGTKIKITTGSSSSDATAIAGAIVKDDNYVAHIFDGNKIVSMASDNVDIDLREIAPDIGKLLGGSGGGKPKMTQCGGPNKDKAKDALELAKKLTKKKLEKS
jgi:alanyl-tRNA synthetase